MAKKKPTNPVGVGREDQEAGFEPVNKQGKKKGGPSPEYPRGIQKIASYSGVTRTMRLKDKSGKFDEIINIYVYPNGIVTDYDDVVIDPKIGDHSISKFNVRKHGEKSKSIWGRKEEEAGYTPPEVAARHKKASKPMRRIVRKHMAVPKGKSSKRK